ncbi:MAG: septum formation initiator family protein [Burkholderiaceae bacterium]|nr:septum formation initiator family protein [Burkholderiaceae bacterium]
MARFTRDRSNMVPRLIVLGLIVLLCLIQYPLWFGKGSFQNLESLKSQLKEQRQTNQDLKDELKQLSAEAESLRLGEEAVEVRARKRFNMIRKDEVLFRLE